jgi:hypothetical protein
MTVFEYIDEISLRLRAYEIAQEADSMQLLSMLNTARKRVQQDTIALYPERYGVILRVEFVPADTAWDLYSNDSATQNTLLRSVDYYRVPLPINMIDAHVVKLCWTADEVDYEYLARRTTKYEMMKVSQQGFTKPTPFNPIYAIAREGGQYVMYIGSLKLKTGDLISAAPELEIWSTMTIADLEWGSSTVDAVEGDSEIVIATELEELVILYTMLSFLQHTNADQALKDLIKNQVDDNIRTLQPFYQQQKQNEELDLATQAGV